MIPRQLKLYPVREVALLVLGITGVFGSILVLFGGGTWYKQYLYTLAYTSSCSVFVGIPICALYERIMRLPRIVRYVPFAVIVAFGAFIGVEIVHLAIERTLSVDKRVLVVSLLMSFIATSAIVAYRRIQMNLRRNITRIEEIELENETLKRYELEARLGSLQAKLNPHFLFNTLNSLAELVYDDPARAEECIVRLSDLYRRVLAVSERTFVPIADELALIENYVVLERLRLDERFSYRVVCPTELRSAMIPGLLIEPLVENAIKHNGGARRLAVEVEIAESDGKIVVFVRDDGSGFDPAKASYGFGLGGIQRRLSLLYGEEHELSIDSAVGKGTRVRIAVPKASEGSEREPCAERKGKSGI